MLKPFIPTLAVVALAGASVGADRRTSGPDVSVWRWRISMILDAQRDADAAGGAAFEGLAPGPSHSPAGVRAPAIGGRR
jgi:hypothetical protein